MTVQAPTRRIIKEDGIVDEVAVRRIAAGELLLAATRKEIRAAALLLSEEGMLQEDIAKTLGITQRTVQRVVAETAEADPLIDCDLTLSLVRELLALGVTQNELALSARVGRGTLTRLLYGRTREVRTSVAVKIANAYWRVTTNRIATKRKAG